MYILTRPCVSMQRENGIPDVFKTFRQSFKQQAKGKGHEVGDLGRLLALYERWHARIFPHCEFDEFIGKVEKLYGRPTGREAKGANLKVRISLVVRSLSYQAENIHSYEQMCAHIHKLSDTTLTIPLLHRHPFNVSLTISFPST